MGEEKAVGGFQADLWTDELMTGGIISLADTSNTYLQEVTKAAKATVPQWELC